LIAVETDRTFGEAYEAIDVYVIAALHLNHFGLPLQTADDQRTGLLCGDCQG
jgi:hypothetical protein